MELFAELMTERKLLRAVVRYAASQGWYVYHPHDVPLPRGGWGTPYLGTRGFVDLLLCRPPRLVFVELKSERGRVSANQRAWLEQAAACGAETYVWRPRDWVAGTIQSILARDPRDPPVDGDSGQPSVASRVSTADGL